MSRNSKITKFRKFADKHPHVLLHMASLHSTLTDEDFDLFCRLEPGWSLKISNRHTPEQFDFCYRKNPMGVLRHAADRLTPDQLTALVAKCKGDLENHFKSNGADSTPGMLLALHSVIDQLELKTANAVRSALARSI